MQSIMICSSMYEIFHLSFNNFFFVVALFSVTFWHKTLLKVPINNGSWLNSLFPPHRRHKNEADKEETPQAEKIQKVFP